MKKLLLREEKKLREILLNQYGIKDNQIEFYSKNGLIDKKIYFTYISSKLVEMNKYLSLNIKPVLIGLYLGVMTKEGLRLSMDAAMILGRKATRNIIELDKKEMQEFLQGIDIELDKDYESGFYIVKHKSIILGTGKISNRKLYNYTPKARRVKTGMIQELKI